MTREERAQMARAMGLDPAEYERYRLERMAPDGRTSVTMGARSPDQMGTAEMCAQMGNDPAEFERWRAGQLAEARRRSASGEALTQTQRSLLEGITRTALGIAPLGSR